MTENDMGFFMSRIEINNAPNKKACLKNSTQFMPQWRLTVTFTMKYIRNIDAPVAKWKILNNCESNCY